MNNTPRQIVEDNFKGLDDAIGDRAVANWYKELIVTCLEEYEQSEAQWSDYLAFVFVGFAFGLFLGVLLFR